MIVKLVARKIEECNSFEMPFQDHFVDGCVRRIQKASSGIIPKLLRTKHATLEFSPWLLTIITNPKSRIIY